MKKLEVDNRYYEDLKVILESFESEKLQQYLDKVNSWSEKDQEHIEMTMPDKGSKFYLEVTVENSLYASALFSWLYSKSPTDNKSPLHLLGCQLHSIHFSAPGLSDRAKEAIRNLNAELDRLDGKKE